VDGVGLGATRPEVEAALGRPLDLVQQQGACTVLTASTLPGVTITIESGVTDVIVSIVAVSTPEYPTTAGVTVGSSTADVQAAYPDAVTVRANGPTTLLRQFRNDRRRSLDFLLRDDLVVQMTAQIFADEHCA